MLTVLALIFIDRHDILLFIKLFSVLGIVSAGGPHSP